ncbi:hypothetical protein GOODEAATRI_002184 [Goodea atripinnis]|uniref:Uncharacterized protein n=1 Tax=Goodea atripinnis TaxID=208336 RepID=A0ABV0PK89_9TELE
MWVKLNLTEEKDGEEGEGKMKLYGGDLWKLKPPSHTLLLVLSGLPSRYKPWPGAQLGLPTEGFWPNTGRSKTH